MQSCVALQVTGASSLHDKTSPRIYLDTYMCVCVCVCVCIATQNPLKGRHTMIVVAS